MTGVSAGCECRLCVPVVSAGCADLRFLPFPPRGGCWNPQSPQGRPFPSRQNAPLGAIPLAPHLTRQDTLPPYPPSYTPPLYTRRSRTFHLMPAVGPTTSIPYTHRVRPDHTMPAVGPTPSTVHPPWAPPEPLPSASAPFVLFASRPSRSSLPRRKLDGGFVLGGAAPVLTRNSAVFGGACTTRPPGVLGCDREITVPFVRRRGL